MEDRRRSRRLTFPDAPLYRDTLETLAAQQEALNSRIDAHLKYLRENCEHRLLYQCESRSSGYIWMCAECFVEESGWSPRVLRSRWIQKIGFWEMMARRPLRSQEKVGELSD